MMDGEIQRVSPLEFREAADGGPGVVSGVVVTYGEVALPPRVPQPERVQAGAFGDVANLDVIGTWQHERSRLLARTGGGGLTLIDSPTELRAEIALPNTSDGRDAGELVRKRVLRGLSTGAAVAEAHFEGGVRVITRAALRFVGLVDHPAFQGSLITDIRSADFDIEWDEETLLELRHDPYASLARRRVSGRIPYNSPGVVSMAQNERLIVEPGAFRDSLQGEIYALSGNDYSQPLASVPDGTLRLRDTDEGLQIELRSLPETAYATDFISRLNSGLIKGITPG